MDSTLATLRTTFDDGITRDYAWRRGQLEALRRAMTEESRAWSEALAADLGRHHAESAFIEIDNVANEAEYAARHLRSWMRPRHAGVPLATLPSRAWTQPTPKGVALIMAPWNYPLMLALTPLVGAIAAGCPAVIKPSEMAPATSRAMAEILPRYLDERAYAVVTGGVETAEALLAERWDHIFFTGSTRVGRVVAKAAAEHLTPVTLELGGKSPAWVDRSVDLEKAARRIAWGRYVNAGQTCVAVDYVMAEPDVADELAAHIGAWTEEFYGKALDSESLGRIVDERAFDRITGYLGDGTIAVGGGHDRETLRIEPTVLTRVDRESPVMTEEIFGPVLPIMDVASAAEAIEFVRSRPRPLTAHVFSEDRAVKDAWRERTHSGTLAFNAPILHMGVPGIPFGGTGDSGMGSSHGRYSFEAFSYERGMMSKPYWLDLVPLIHPPYTPGTEAFITKVIPWVAKAP